MRTGASIFQRGTEQPRGVGSTRPCGWMALTTTQNAPTLADRCRPRITEPRITGPRAEGSSKRGQVLRSHVPLSGLDNQYQVLPWQEKKAVLEQRLACLCGPRR
jgi:hypothetical protein